MPQMSLLIALVLAQPVPKFRQHAFYVAFIEGWALYSERLGEDAGF